MSFSIQFEDEDPYSTDSDGEDPVSDDSIEGAAPTSKNRRCAREEGLNASLHSGLYPTFKGIEGSVNRLDPTSNSAFEYLQQLRPCSLCELIALETYR